MIMRIKHALSMHAYYAVDPRGRTVGVQTVTLVGGDAPTANLIWIDDVKTLHPKQTLCNATEQRYTAQVDGRTVDAVLRLVEGGDPRDPGNWEAGVTIDD